MDPSQYDQYDDLFIGHDDGAQYVTYDDFNIDWEAGEIARLAADGNIGFGDGSIAGSILPQPPALQIQAQLDADGNWYYPSLDRHNHELRIQCEAYRAGAASRNGVAQPWPALKNDILAASSLGKRRKSLKPDTRPSSKFATRRTAKGRTKKTSVAQVCVCHEASSTPKRPANAFIMFRRMFQRKLAKAVRDQPSLRGKDSQGRDKTEQAAISSLASDWWKDVKSKGEEKIYFELAEKEKVSHAAKFPGYKYEAGKKGQLKWGDENCTCGAYQANEAKRRNPEREAERRLGFDLDREDYAGEARRLGLDLDRHECDVYGGEEGQEADSRDGSTTLKRTRSHTGLGEPVAKRTRTSTVANTIHNTGYSTGFDSTSVFPTETYDASSTDITFGGGLNDDTVLYNTMQPDNLFDFPPSRSTRSKSFGAGDLPIEQTQLAVQDDESFPSQTSPPAYGTRSRSIPRFAQPDFNATEITDEDFQAMLEEGLEANYSPNLSPTRELVDSANPGQNLADDARRRSGGSLFYDMDDLTGHRSSVSKRLGSRRSSRPAQSPTSPKSMRRNSRRSRG